MRWLLWIALAATAAWTGYWWVGATTIETSVSAWIKAQPEDQISAASVEVHGIPNRFDLTITDLALRSPDLPLRWQTPFAQVFAMTWKPWHLIAALPTGQKITYQDQTLTLNSSQMMGDVMVHPDSDLTLREVVTQSRDLQLISNAGWQISAASLLASLREDPTAAHRYRLGLRLADLLTDASLTPKLAAAGLPPKIDEGYLDAHVSLTAALDRSAAQRQPRPSEIDLDALRLIWGDLRLNATGRITADAMGYADGDIQIDLQGWQMLPPLLVSLGLVQPQMQQTMTTILQNLASQNGAPEDLTLTLVAKNGRMQLGPLPLGPAPLLSWP